MPEARPPSTLWRHASAVITTQGGKPVIRHYGSAAGELAACVSGVGVALRTDLTVVSVTAPARSLVLLARRVLNHELLPGGTAIEGGAWWSRDPESDRLFGICRQSAAERLTKSLRRALGPLTSTGRVDLDPTRCVVINLLGPLTASVLDGLGVVKGQGLSTIAPFSRSAVGPHRVAWLIEASTAVLAITDNAGAPSVWQAIEDAGRGHSVACVGMDATERYLLLERARRAAPLLL
jgi:hypothetical protein